MKKIIDKNINAFLVVDKPKGYTSFDVVRKVSKILGIKKIGHTGTLDPLATGVLILCLGKYTKLSNDITNDFKEYIALVELGTSSDTYDITGNIINEVDASNIKRKDILECLNHFVGKQKQEVPIYSAVKVNGRKLYDYARLKRDVKLPFKDIDIKSIELLEDICYLGNKIRFSIKCVVSKGTYIRSLINDIGCYLKVGALMVELRRVRQGSISLKDAYTLEDIENGNYKLLGIKDIWPDLKVILVDDDKLINNGNVILNKYNVSKCLFINKNKEEIAIYEAIDDYKYLKPYKMLK